MPSIWLWGGLGRLCPAFPHSAFCLLHFPEYGSVVALGGLIPPAADHRKRGHSWRGSLSARRNPRGSWPFQSKQGRPGKAELRRPRFEGRELPPQTKNTRARRQRPGFRATPAQLKQSDSSRGWRRAAEPQPNGANRLECVQLAGAVARRGSFESGSKLRALQTLRVAVHEGLG